MHIKIAGSSMHTYYTFKTGITVHGPHYNIIYLSYVIIIINIIIITNTISLMTKTYFLDVLLRNVVLV